MLKHKSLIIFVFTIFITKILLINSKNLLISNLFQDNNGNDCPDNCYDNKCDNGTLKCESCIEGYYSDFCDKICPVKNCIKCEQDDGKCIDCDSNFKLIDNTCCENFCKKCNDDGCLECEDLDKYGQKCSNCPSNCKSIQDERKCEQESGKCYSCNKGKWGDECDKTCNSGCDLNQNNCEQESGKCYSCNKGKWGDECDKNCNSGCDLNQNNCEQNTGDCICKDNYYGKTCENECDINCKDCNKENGTCYECKNNYYIDSSNKTKCIECPKNCDGGVCPNGICKNCKNSFYGDVCDKNCSENCLGKKCDKETGECDCINHYSKESNCKNCENFYSLESQCINCIENYDPTNNCSKCKFNYDFDKGCKECRNNYNITSQCQECIMNYNKSNDCLTCINHYDIDYNCRKCQNFYNITDNCNSCIKNYDIEEKCTKCINHYDFSTNCSICESGYFGTDCESNCYEGCNYELSNCDKKDGKCENCIRGYFNDYCNETCNEHCLGGIYSCDPKTGKCDKCEELYFGPKCEYKSEIEFCIKVNMTNGECLECKETYYLVNNTCRECSNNCTNKKCEDITGYCESCKELNMFGVECEKYCSPFCQNNGTNYICDRKEGFCKYGCQSGYFENDFCTDCREGYYSINEGCQNECSDNCENKLNCDPNDGSCNICKNGYWGKQCTENCDEICKKKECNHDTGECFDCIDGYFKNGTKCQICPINCNTCGEGGKCITCKDGKYGEEKCDLNCSIHCEGNTCDIKGRCNCESKYWGDFCDNICKGCSDNGCEDKEGICNDHYCLDNYYDPRKCDQECSEKCEGQKCDLFTGECISCPNNMWGKNCSEECSDECKDDGRLECCYIKKNEKIPSKGIRIDISYETYNNLKEEQNEFSFINIKLGETNLKILADFESNSPLVIFDSDTQYTEIETEIYTINVSQCYKSSQSKFPKGESFDIFYEYDGFFLTKEINAKDDLQIGEYIFRNFTFLIIQEFKIEKDFVNAGPIDGIVGLGLRNYFTENLFYNKEGISFPKNILLRNVKDHKKTSFIYIGDYPQEIKNSFSKLSTMIIENKQLILMDKLITFETKFTGIAYSLRKAYHYQYDKRVILNNRKETAIVFNNLYKQFFEKIYFGDLFENGCYFKNLQGGEGEYYCEKSKKSQIQSLPKLGLILGDYIYYLSHEFLYKESEDYYTFLIKLHGQGQQKIELGKSFFNEFSVIYNNGNETLNFFGDIKKLNVPLKDPSNLLNVDSDIFTPGGWVTLIVFITVLIIIFCYLIKYCGEKTGNEDDEEDDIDYEDDSLIDDTLE